MFVSAMPDDGLVAGELQQDPDSVSDRRIHVLPPDLETISPGPFLASILSVVDPEKLVGRDVVRYVQAQGRLVAHFQASYYKGVSELAFAVEADTIDRDTVPNEYASDELAAAVAQTRRAAEHDVDLALDLRTRIPQVWGALAEGAIGLAKARVFAQELTTLRTDLVPVVVNQVLTEAAELTTGQLRARLKKLVITADQAAAETQYRAGLEDRRVTVYPNPDHTATLCLSNITPQDALQISHKLHTRALSLKRIPGETRTIDQLKADITVDLLQGNTTTGDSRLDITIHTTPGDVTSHVTGYGPILPTSLQDLLDEAVTTTIHTTDTASEAVSSDCHQTPRRRPARAQIQHVTSRYPTCVHPGCRMPSHRCDLDHRKPWNRGGKTTCANLAPLCRHHHQCKTKGGWLLQRNPDGSHTFTSPLGHTYTTGLPP